MNKFNPTADDILGAVLAVLAVIAFFALVQILS